MREEIAPRRRDKTNEPQSTMRRSSHGQCVVRRDASASLRLTTTVVSQSGRCRSALRSGRGTPARCRRGSARRDARARRWRRRCPACARRLRSRRHRASPFMNPPRNASPTPVGSTMRCGGTAGTSVRAGCREDRAAVLALASRPAPRACASIVGLVEPGLLPDQLELVVVADHERRAARRHRCSSSPDIRAHC